MTEVQTCALPICETPVVKAPKEKNIIPGSFATPEAIAYIMTQKFVMGSPLYRQEQEINRQGMQLSRQTMSNWILRATEDYLVPVYQSLHEELLKREVLHADETRPASPSPWARETGSRRRKSSATASPC